jgi:calcineurin-like phosphoesterase family protein
MRIDLGADRVFITGDSHYGHSNIVRGTTTWDISNIGCLRDFDTVEEMNSAIVKNINDKVSENDILIHVGDWSFGGKDRIKEFRDRINCKRILLCRGNHDDTINKKEEYQSLFYRYFGGAGYPSVRFVIDGKNYICGHYPLKIWEFSHHGSRHAFGHVHGSMLDDSGSLSWDVGLDNNNLSPLSVLEFEEIMSRKTWKQISHHNSGTN